MKGDDNNDGDHPKTSNTSPLVPSPTQQIPHTVSSIKLPILKKGEYDIWAMKMEHYLSHTDYPIWKVIHNGIGLISVTTDTNGLIKVLPPKTAKEVVKYLLKQQFEGFSVSTSEGLHKGYDRFQTLLSQLEIHGAGVSHEDANQKFLRSLPSSWSQVALIMRTKPGLNTLSFDDLYNNLRVFERDVKGTTISSSNTQNVAFVSAENTSNTNDVSTAYSVFSPSVLKSQKEGSSSYTNEAIHSFCANKSSAPQLDYDDLEQINDDDMEEMDLKCRRRDVGYNGNKTRDDGRRPAYQDDSKALVTVDGEDIDCRLLNTQMSANDKFGLVPPPMTGNYMPFGPDVEIDYFKFTNGPKQTSADEPDSKLSEYASCESDSSVKTSTYMLEPVENASKVICKPKVWTDAPLIEEYDSNGDNDSVSNVQEDKEKHSFAFTDYVKHVKTSRENIKESGTTNHGPKIKKHDRNSHTRKGLGYAFTRKACFVCGSFSHLIRDCDFHEKRTAKQAELTKSKKKDDPHRALKDKGIIDNGCSKHMTGNKAHLADYQEFKGGSVAFEGSNGRITGKGKIKTGRQEEGIDYDEVFAPVARIEAIRIFLAFASYMGFILYQIDVKCAFLYGTIVEEVYVSKPPGFVDPKFPNKKSWCDEFEELMKNRFQMSSMGELTFFLGLQVKQKEDGIFISQDKYVAKVLKKFDFLSVKTTSTPIKTQKPLVKDKEAADVDVHLYRSMIGSLMYLTASRPDIIFAVCACFSVIIAYSDSDYAGANLDKKSTTGGCQFLGRRLISWQCKKKTIVATSTTEAEYVATAHSFFHSKIKHIEIRNHFIRDDYEKKLNQVLKIHTDDNVADLLTKAFDFIMSNTHQELASPEENDFCKELACPKQTALGKDISNPLMAGRLPKTTMPTRIQALVDEKQVNIKESSIRRTLKLDDAKGTSCLANAEIFNGLAKMGYEKLSKKLTFYKAFFLPQWKFLIHTILQCLSAKTTSWNEFSSTLASAIICLATNKKFNFSMYILLSLVTNIEDEVPFFMFPRFVQLLIDHQLGDMSRHKDIYDNPSLTKKVFANMRRVGNMLVPAAEEVAPKVPSLEPSPEYRLPLPSNDPLPDGKDSMKLKELMDLCTHLSNKFIELESEVINLKSTYKERIEKLESKVDRLEEENGVLKDLHNVPFKVDTVALVVENEKSFKHGRIIADIDEDVKINLKEAQAKLYKIDLQHPKKVLSMQDVDEEEHANVEEVLEVQFKDKGKGILVEEPKPLKGQAQIEQDEAFARQLEAELNADINWNAIMEQVKRSERLNDAVIKYQALKKKPLTEAQARKNMIIYLKNMDGFKMNYFKVMTYSEIIPLFEKHYNYNQAFLEEVNEEVILPEKEVEVEAHKRDGESIEKEITKKQKMDKEVQELRGHLQIVSNDDDDLYTKATPLASKIPIVDYKIHFERNKPYYKIIRADGNHMLFLSFGTLLKNFDREDLESLWKLVKKASVWRDQKGRYGLAKRYPLTHFTLEKMLNNVRLKVKEESEMSLELLRLVRRQLNEGYAEKDPFQGTHNNEVFVDVREQIVEKEVSIVDPVTTAGEVVTASSIEDNDAPTTATTAITTPTAKEVARKLKDEMRAKMEEEERIAREKDEANRVVIEEWDDVQAIIDADRQRKYFATKRAEEIRNKPPTKAQQKSLMCTYIKNMEGFKQKYFKEKSFDDINKIFDKVYKRVNTFVDMDTENVEESLKKTQAEGNSKRAGQELEQESVKKQMLAKQEQDKVADDDNAELKRCLEIVPKDDDDVAIEATPLSSKSHTIVDYNIYREGKKSYFKIIITDQNSQNYLTFRTMFKNFNREDLEVLRSIVKERFKKTKPVDDMENLLFQTLKTTFEPHVEDIIWKYQQGAVKVYNWKLFDSCKVYYVTTKTMMYYLMAEKMYLFTNSILHQLWSDVRLQIDYEEEMAYNLLRLIKKHINEWYKPE
nr:putative ribonuclease H-like domain-containing protein [Tanacetum cinerariifolium]